MTKSHINSNNRITRDTNDRQFNTDDTDDDDKQMDTNSNSRSRQKNYITMWRVDPNVKENQRIMSHLILNPKMMDLSDATLGDKKPIAWKVKFLIVLHCVSA